MLNMQSMRLKKKVLSTSNEFQKRTSQTYPMTKVRNKDRLYEQNSRHKSSLDESKKVIILPIYLKT